jgi:two-component system LytT family response regulator
MDVIIVDDEPSARRAVREGCEREADLRVVGEYGDARAALEAIRQQPPQVLFLDIQMDAMTGMELARSLDPVTLPLIVFVTAYDHYALEAFEVSAVDYLLKPFDDARFQATVARVRRRQAADGGFDRQGALATLLEQLESRARLRAEAQRAAACICSTSRRWRWSNPTATTCASSSAARAFMPAARSRRRRSPSSTSRCCASVARAS